MIVNKITKISTIFFIGLLLVIAVPEKYSPGKISLCPQNTGAETVSYKKYRD
jgi:hypothetical protein